MSPRNNPWAFSVLTLCWVTALMETDIYVPCFPDMVIYFGITEAQVQNIISFNFLGFCLACLAYGPLSDSWGRKNILMFGNTIFALAGIGCVLTDSFTTLCAWRFIQGIGAATVFSVGAAAFFDIYDEMEAAKKIGIINFLIAGVMAGAPLVGTWMNSTWGWYSTFLLIAIQSVTCVLALAFLFKESLPIEKRKPLSLSGAFKDYFTLMTSSKYMFNTIAACILISCLVAYTASLSLIFINYLGISTAAYGFYQGAVLVAFAIASLLTGRVIEKFGIRKVCTFSTLYTPIGLGILYAISVYWPDAALAFTIVMAITTAIYSVSMGAFAPIVMSTFPEIRGAAGSLMSALRMLLTSGFVGICAWRFDGTMQSLAQTLLIGTIIGAVLYFYAYWQESGASAEEKADAKEVA